MALFKHLYYKLTVINLIRYTCVPAPPPLLLFRTALISHDRFKMWDFGPCWCDRITHAAGLLAAHPWCVSPVPLHPKGAVLDCDLVTVESICIHWTQCHVQDTSVRYEIYEMMRHIFLLSALTSKKHFASNCCSLDIFSNKVDDEWISLELHFHLFYPKRFYSRSHSLIIQW